ncbi:MAG: adenylate/guanylate cyclase domain-containing protein, partial [Alphaproteobacteria bacterium]
MRTALMLGFGGLVLAAVFVVLMLGLWSARENTVSLTRKLAEAVLDDVQSAIEQRLSPAEAAVAYLGRRIEAGQIKLGGDDLAQALSSALAGLPQVGALIFLDENADGILVIRGDESSEVRTVAYAQSPKVLRQFETAKSRHRVHWGRVLRAPDNTLTVLNVRKAIRIDGRFAGILVASVTISQLSTMLAAKRLAMDGEIFVLYDQRFVLAHRRLAKGYDRASPEQPLPLVKDFGDPILAAYVNPDLGPDYGGRMSREMGVQIVGTADGEAYPLVARRLNWFGEVPWEIGVYFRDDAVEAEFNRVMGASIAGLVALLLSLVLAWLLSRHISQPLKALARAAGNVRDLSLDNYSPLPANRIREMDDAGLAFNNMVTSLRWFETYVPRSLVRRLMRQGEGVLERSEQREVTVLFTDIVGFTATSENMAVAETAALLNEHFAQVGSCIEAEGGTIDKFIGDSVMAFWGAPEEQPDHAARACRAALAIRAAVEAGNDAKPGTPLRLRIGIHTGPVIVGNIGAPQRMNYTIVGDSVNIAHRLEQLGHILGDANSAVTILLSQVTRDAAGITEADALGPQRIRGRREALAVFR